MPIVKVPNKQKFGIVSLTRVGELLVDHDKQDPKRCIMSVCTIAPTGLLLIK